MKNQINVKETLTMNQTKYEVWFHTIELCSLHIDSWTEAEIREAFANESNQTPYWTEQFDNEEEAKALYDKTKVYSGFFHNYGVKYFSTEMVELNEVVYDEDGELVQIDYISFKLAESKED